MRQEDQITALAREYAEWITKDYGDHNRLHIAAMAMAGIMANPKAVCGRSELKEDRAWVVEMSLSYADALMKAAGKGGGK